MRLCMTTSPDHVHHFFNDLLREDIHINADATTAWSHVAI